MGRPSIRAVLVVLVAAMALIAAVVTSLPSWLMIATAAFVVVVAARALRALPGRHHVERMEGGRIRLRTPSADRVQGALEPVYGSGFYCAFVVHDPVRGARHFGLFRDELDRAGWRRLRVALRAGGRP